MLSKTEHGFKLTVY